MNRPIAEKRQRLSQDTYKSQETKSSGADDRRNQSPLQSSRFHGETGKALIVGKSDLQEIEFEKKKRAKPQKVFDQNRQQVICKGEPNSF